MEEQRYQDVLEEHARLTRHPVRALLLLVLFAIALGLIFGRTHPNALERYLMHDLFHVESDRSP
jgi:hypothetical protein